MHRRLLLTAATAAILLAGPAAAHVFDHAPPGRAPTGPPNPVFQSGGEGAEWKLLGTIPTGNPHSDLDFFVRDGITYAAVGTLGTGPNSGGVTIVKLADADGTIAPSYVSGHGSAACLSDPSATLGLQHDVEATPKGGTILNTTVPGRSTEQAQLIVDATDAEGRCHDQGVIANAPKGGLELVDITDVTDPVEIGLTSHIGEAHTVNVDPRRPHIAYAVSSDAVTVTNGVRQNEVNANNGTLDGWEVVDMSSCMYFPEGTTLEQKREQCRPEVYRYRYPSLEMAWGHTNKGTIYGCHELEVYPEDKLTCGGGSAMMLFDISKAFDDNGTPNDFTDDKPKGTPLNCPVRPSSSTPPFRTGAMVVDCGTADFNVKPWLESGAPSLEGVEHLGSAFHMGRESATGAFTPDFNSDEDIDFDHEAEFTHSRKFVLATDERGGGVLPPGATCSQANDNLVGNGGIHAYAVDRLQKTVPETAEEAHKAYALNSEGKKAIYRAPVRTGAQASLCTAHVFQQIPGQNRIFMGWYSQGTQVVDFVENPDGTVDFKEAAHFIPANANQWVSHVFRVVEESDGSFTYFGAAADFNIGERGRSAIDVYSVNLPAPTRAAPPAGETPPTTTPPGDDSAPPAGGGQQQQPGGLPPTSTGTPAAECAPVRGFRRADAQPRGRGRGLRLAFERLQRRPVRVDIFRQSAGRTRLLGEKRVAAFGSRSSSFNWSARNAGDGTYVVRFTMRLTGGRSDVRRVALERRNGRWVRRPSYYNRTSCGLLNAAKLERPVFGGRANTALLASFRLREAAAVTVVIRNARGQVVRRYRERTYSPDRTHRLRLRAERIRRGAEATVEITARRSGTQASARLVARRL